MNERVALSDQYQAQEEQAGAGSLPLLVISPAAKVMPTQPLLQARRMEALEVRILHGLGIADPYAVTEVYTPGNGRR